MKKTVKKLSNFLFCGLILTCISGVLNETFAQKKKKKSKTSEVKKTIAAPIKGPSVEGISEYNVFIIN